MKVEIEASWQKVLEKEFEKPYFKQLVTFVREEYGTQKCYPKGSDLFNAFSLTPFDAVKVVILGQDPYHGVNQAHGLSFSVLEGVKNPPSLQNILKELQNDVGIEAPSTGNLSPWAKQGVLLLNATLSVRENEAGSHQGKGWEVFTDEVIRQISARKEHVVFILWGSYAQQKSKIIDTEKHCILKAPHPSPLSSYRGFFGSKPFSVTNAYLESKGISPIDWAL